MTNFLCFLHPPLRPNPWKSWFEQTLTISHNASTQGTFFSCRLVFEKNFKISPYILLSKIVFHPLPPPIGPNVPRSIRICTNLNIHFLRMFFNNVWLFWTYFWEENFPLYIFTEKLVKIGPVVLEKKSML